MEFKKKATVLALLALSFEGADALAESPLTQQLKEQAQFWAQRGKDDNAADAWRKLLKIDPANADALTALGVHEVNAGNMDLARSYYSRLRGSNASSAQVKSLETALKRGAGSGSASQIDEVRRLARQGDSEAAAEAFKRVADPAKLQGDAALEYYQVLAGSKQAYAEAKKGLEKLSKANPSNHKYALVYAQVLTYREATRPEGLQLLEKLAAKTEVSAQAIESWRQALSWMPAKSENSRYFRRYAEKYPDDQQIALRLAESTNPVNNREELANHKVVAVQAETQAQPETKSVHKSQTETKKADEIKLAKAEKTTQVEKNAKASATSKADDGSEAESVKPVKENKNKHENSADKHKMTGFKALEENDVETAKVEFTALLKAYPKDPAAHGGMGLIKMRQEEFKEARSYLQKAVDLSPAHAKDQWRQALDGASYWAYIEEARNQFEEGESVKGIELLKKAIALNEKEPSGILQLADALQAENDLAGAEQNFRRVFDADKQNLRALDGLIGVLTLQKRIADLEALSPHMLPRHLAIVANLKSTDLYDKAKLAEQAGDIGKAQALLEDAILIKPENAWLRMALAKIYLKRKMPDQARALIDAMTQVQNPDSEALYVSALLSEMQQQWWDALLTLERIPAAARKTEMYTMQKRIWIRVQLDRIDVYTQQGNLARAREVLTAVETAAGNDPEFLGTLANLYIKFGDTERGSAMIRQAVQNTANPPAGLLLQYASTLIRSNQEAELEAVMRKVAAMPKLEDAEIVAFQQLQKVLALRYSERTREAGDFANAYNYLQPLLIAEPDDSLLLLALARIYNSAGDQDAARELYAKVLHSEPDNPEVLQGIVYASMQMRDLSTAEKHLSTLLKLQPDNPRYLSLAGNIARAQGNNSRALSYFKQALALEQAQSAVIGGGANGLRLVNNGTQAPSVSDFKTNPFANGQYAQNAPANASTASARLPVLREVQNNLASAAPGSGSAAVATVKTEKSGIFAPVGVPLQGAPATNPNLPTIPQLPVKASDKPSSQLNLQSQSVRLESSATQALQSGAASKQPVLNYLSGAGGTNRGAAGGAGDTTQFAQASPAYRYEVPAKRNSQNTAATRNYVSPEEAALMKEIDAINEMRRTQVTADISIRARSGEKGLSQLKDIETPIEAQINTLGLGQFGLKIIPVMLDAGSFGVNDTNVAGQFGKNAILVERAKYAKLPVTTILKQRGLPANPEIAQEANGVALSMSYELAGVKVDIGTSPSGFPVRNIVGGVRWSGDVEGVQLGVEATRRSVTDSLLAYAGTSDNLYGQSWGGVTKTGVKFDTSYDFDEGGLYASAGYYVLNGKNVARNSMFELGGGAYWRAYKTNDTTITTGLGLTSFFYNRNLRYFSFGHGGYFSPKSYVALGIPLEISGRKGKLSYQIGGSVGVQHFRELAAPYYPVNVQDQIDLELFAAANPLVNVQTYYPGQSRTGISFKLNAGLEYLLNPHISLGGRFSADNSGDFNDASASMYLRYTFEPRKVPVSYPPVAPKPNYSGN